MSVEFQVRINEPIVIGQCAEESSKVLTRLLGDVRVPINVELCELENGLSPQAVVKRGVSSQSFSISAGEDALVDVDVYDFENPDFREEAGTWLVAEVRLRTELSFVLSLSFAVAVALKTRSTVLDDAGHLNLGRHLNPDEVIETLRLPVSSTSLEAAASWFCKSIRFRFGDD
ncbi:MULTISPECIES: hypothetical protein [Sorangium]|uniref:hypothetical protein n=1 Tax=Sorangium TaxID=39643 RepID=UPI00101A7445|nr:MULTISPECIES: hypothetical protein [Sorangium]